MGRVSDAVANAVLDLLFGAGSNSVAPTTLGSRDPGNVKQLAAELGIHHSVVHRVLTGERWKEGAQNG